MDRAAFYRSIRASLFGGHMSQAQVEGCEVILDEWDAEAKRVGAYGRRQHLSYMLATAFHETAATMQPVREGYYLGEESGKAERYRKKLRYYPWYGRGLVQLTWEANYQKADDELGLHGTLIGNPDLALDHTIAVRVMFAGMRAGWFAGDRKGRHTLARYLYPGHTDFIGARRIINGQDCAVQIAGYAEKFDDAILAAVATAAPA
jgi:hypothetical protein